MSLCVYCIHVWDMAQSYLIGTAKFVRPVQLLDNGPAKLSQMKVTFDFISTSYILSKLLIFVQFRNMGLMGNFYESFMPSPWSTSSKLSQESPGLTTPPALREISLST